MPTGLSLEARVKLLEAQVAALTLTVQQQRCLIEELQASGGGSSSEFEVLPVSQNDRAVSATAVSGHLGASEPGAPAFVPALPAAASSTPGAQSLPSVSVEDRSTIAREVGAFLRRALDGLLLHSSGSDRNPLRNRHYIICQDFEGRALSPPLVVDRFSTVRDRCKRGSDCGRSIFVGLPRGPHSSAGGWTALLLLAEWRLKSCPFKERTESLSAFWMLWWSRSKERLSIATSSGASGLLKVTVKSLVFQAAEVVACSEVSRFEADPAVKVKVWLGYRAQGLVEQVDYPMPGNDRTEHSFVTLGGTPALPHADGLVSASQEAFADVFTTASEAPASRISPRACCTSLCSRRAFGPHGVSARRCSGRHSSPGLRWQPLSCCGAGGCTNAAGKGKVPSTGFRHAFVSQPRAASFFVRRSRRYEPGAVGSSLELGWS